MRTHKPTAEELQLLKELDSLQDFDQSASIEPPGLIDQAVRNMARREVQNQRSPLAGKLRFIAGLSTASIALIALGLSLLQSPPTPDPADISISSKQAEISSVREESLSTEQLSPGLARSALESTDATTPATPAAAATLENLRPAEEVMYSKIVSTTEKAESALAWLDLIRQLQEQGLVEEASQQLQAWREKYPDEPLPDWATQLLPPQP